MNYKFSGHETFHCRPIWLKKGYDYAKNGTSFNDNQAVINLGVGKNMVSSIKFWLKAFGFYNLKNELVGLSDEMLNDEGFDPFLENEASIYLLHYFLIKNKTVSSIYYLTFIKFSKEKLEFTPDQLLKFLERECIKEHIDYNEKTLKNDINVLIKNYIPSSEKKMSIEDNYSGLFYDLRYINKIKSFEGDIKYRFNINDGKYLPESIFLYIILDMFPDNVSISIEEIREKVSSNFLMEKQGTYKMIERLVAAYPDQINFKDDGGRQEIQIKQGLDKIEILKKYYEGV